jgi:hypothetical protein
VVLNVVQYEEINALLQQVPRLVDRLQDRHSDYPSEVLSWLRRAETAMENNHLPASSQLAACRAVLLGADRGVRHPEIELTGRPTVRKVRDAAASWVLERSSALLHSVIAERQAVFQEAERIAQQVVAVADAKGLLAPCAGLAHQQFLEGVQRQVAQDPDLASAHTHLVALVGRTDELIFFDRALGRIA